MAQARGVSLARAVRTKWLGLALALGSVGCTEQPPHALAKEHPALSGPPVLVAIADRVEIRAAAEPDAAVIGRLRAGAMVERHDEPIDNVGCEGGWYAIEPRGFVCHWGGTTLDRSHRVARALEPADVALPLPYRYARARRSGAVAYHLLPSTWMQRIAEPYR